MPLTLSSTQRQAEDMVWGERRILGVPLTLSSTQGQAEDGEWGERRFLGCHDPPRVSPRCGIGLEEVFGVPRPPRGEPKMGYGVRRGFLGCPDLVPHPGAS